MLMIKLIKRIVIGLLFLANISFCETISIEPGQNEPIKTNVTVNGFEWVLIPIPDSVEAVGDYHLLDAERGWAKFKINGETQLYRTKNGRWMRVNCPTLKFVDPLFAISENEVWFVVPSSLKYKKNILHYKDGTLQLYETPNSNGIRDIFFKSPQQAWAACEWGQILKFDGTNWKLFPSPTVFHINQIRPVANDVLYAVGDTPEKTLLKYENGSWKRTLADKDRIYSLVRFYYYAEDLKKSLKNDRNYDVLYPESDKTAIQSDTLSFSGRPFSYIWAIKNQSTYSSAGIAYGERFDGKKRIVLALMKSKKVQIRNLVFSSYAFCSKKGLEKRIVIKMPLQDNTVSFARYNYFERTQETGICVYDFNRDGFEDFFVVVTGKPNRFLLSTEKAKEGIFDHINNAKDAGLIGRTQTISQRRNYDVSATCVDIDNDSDQDILVTSLYGPNELYKQVRKLKFKESARTLSLCTDFARSHTGIWSDVNNDGYIDLFVANEDSTNHLYLNNGAGIFRDVTNKAGLYLDRGGSSAVFGDIDGDGDEDLFVPRYGAPNKLYRNDCSVNCTDSVHFTDITEWSGVAGADSIARSSNGLFGDFDNDGDLDLFVTNSGQKNWLYLNQGDGQFLDFSDESGLASDGFTHMAVYLDADNDGDLDLFVCSREGNILYQNQGNATFVDSRLKNISFAKNYPSGVATGDFDNDGDLDIYYSDGSNCSFFLKNATNDTNFIKIVLSCSRSNRDGIGSKLYMYRQGHLGDKAYLLGMRYVRGGDGKRSMSSRIVHFGVPDGEPKDILIKFPSGIERKLFAITPGQQITVHEEVGLARNVSLLKKWYARNTRFPPNQREALFVIAYFIFLIALFFITKRKSAKTDFIHSGWLIPFALFLTLYIILRETNYFAHYFLPMLLSLSAWGIGYYMSTKFRTNPQARMEYQEQLFLATNAFFHGEWGARKLNRLQLYCTNLNSNEIPRREIQDALLESIDDYFHLVVPEIEKIINLAKACGIKGDAMPLCENHLLSASSLLNNLKTEINLKGRIKSALVNSVVENIQFLQADLRAFGKSVSQQFMCDTRAIAKRALENFSVNGIRITLQSGIKPNTFARIRPSEFSQIFDNLIANAIRAVEQTKEKQIVAELTANSDFVFVRVADTGCGVDPEIKDKLFVEQISTKKGDGGLGLFQSRIILKRYGGDISLLPTENGTGSVFEIKLKRVDNE